MREGEMPTLDELTAMVESAGGDPQKLVDAAKQIIGELTGAQKQLHEVNKEAADRRKRLEALEAAEQERKTAEMTEAQKLQAAQQAAEDRAKQAETSIGTLQAQNERYSATIKKHLETQRAGLPAYILALLDKLDPADQLEYIAANAEALRKTEPQPPVTQPKGTPPARQPLGGNKKPENIPVVRVSY